MQLVISHVKYNLLALLYWTLIVLIITDNLGSAFGIPLLFFSPEYLGEVTAWSFLTLGFAIGGFTMGFHTYSYIKLAPNFSFLASLERPFYKFCLNNSFIPLVFNLLFIYQFASHQYLEEFASAGTVVLYCFGYLFGFFLFHLLSFLYFFPMNKRALKTILDPLEEKRQESVAKTVIPNKEKWSEKKIKDSERSFLYLGTGWKIKSSRSNQHYSSELLLKIYEQNKINATIFETLSLITFISLGLFRDLPYFELPAAVSIVLLLTIILMLFSALISWLHRWTYPVLIIVFLLMDTLSVHSPFFTFRNYAYGLVYDQEERIPYNIENIENKRKDEEARMKSHNNMLSILEAWKAKTGQEKPKLVLLNVSGGGSRSALWVLNCLQNLDQETDFALSRHLQMITGASGGMIGASYYREIMHRYRMKKIENPFDTQYKDGMAADVLNRLAFAACTNDVFFRYQSVDIHKQTYTKDRGYAFESQLNKNTDGILDVPFSYYAPLEQNADVPLMIFAPTIVNDGRRLLMSTQTLSFLAAEHVKDAALGRSFENIDYMSFFGDINPLEVQFSTVLRMSATFPFVMPMVTLPTEPEIQLMDAGLRDNYGGKVTMDYLHSMKDWIKKNTSGVIIVQIRDTKKILDNETYKQVSLINKFTLPFGNMYKNFPRTQSFNQDQLLQLGIDYFDFPMDIVSFNLREKNKDKISLSWHLTSEEKKRINEAFESRSNQYAFRKLKKLLEN